MQIGRIPFTVDDVKRMYTGLARHFNHYVVQQFQSKPLVYIAYPAPAKWVKLDVCR